MEVKTKEEQFAVDGDRVQRCQKGSSRGSNYRDQKKKRSNYAEQ